MVLGVTLYVSRYLFYCLPILIAGAVNGFTVEDVFNVVATGVAIILIPLSSVCLSAASFWVS